MTCKTCNGTMIKDEDADLGDRSVCMMCNRPDKPLTPVPDEFYVDPDIKKFRVVTRSGRPDRRCTNGRRVSIIRERKAYIQANKENIIADYMIMGRLAFFERWHANTTSWKALMIEWGVPLKRGQDVKAARS